MEIEQKIAIEAKKLSEYYANYYVKKYPRQKQTIINKFLPIFNKAATMFCIREGYDAKKLIDVFMMNGFKYPNQILNEYFWKEYEKVIAAIIFSSQNHRFFYGWYVCGDAFIFLDFI